jgi:hypothetical protein
MIGLETDWLQVGCLESWFPLGAWFFSLSHNPFSNVYDGLFPWEYGSQDMQFVIHFLLLPRYRKCGALRPHPQYIVMTYLGTQANLSLLFMVTWHFEHFGWILGEQHLCFSCTGPESWLVEGHPDWILKLILFSISKRVQASAFKLDNFYYIHTLWNLLLTDLMLFASGIENVV